MAISTSNQNSSSTQYPACAEPGYVTTLTVGGRVYQIFACIEEPNGTKNYLPSNCNPQTFEKIQSLTSGLINAHEARRQSLNEAPYDLKMLDVRGLMKADNTLVSHDFLIQPVSLLIADQMASAISLAGQPMQAPAVKAIDIWTTMEELIQNEIGGTSRPAQLPIQNIPTPSSPLPTSTNSTPPETDQPLDPHTPPPPASTNSTRAETNQHTPASPPPPLSNESAPLSTPRKWITASEPDLQGGTIGIARSPTRQNCRSLQISLKIAVLPEASTQECGTFAKHGSRVGPAMIQHRVSRLHWLSRNLKKKYFVVKTIAQQLTFVSDKRLLN